MERDESIHTESRYWYFTYISHGGVLANSIMVSSLAGFPLHAASVVDERFVIVTSWMEISRDQFECMDKLFEVLNSQGKPRLVVVKPDAETQST